MRSQRGWVGMVVLLLALLIVAWLAQDALKRYGLMPPAVPAAKPGDLPRGPAIGPAPSVDPGGTAPAPTSAIERARGVEREVQRGAEDLSRRIDEQTK